MTGQREWLASPLRGGEMAIPQYLKGAAKD
jgi:hypothetical protein